MMLAMTAGLTIERYAGLLAALDSDGAGALQRALAFNRNGALRPRRLRGSSSECGS